MQVVGGNHSPKKTKGLNTFMSRKFVFALAMASELGFPASPSPSLDFWLLNVRPPIRRKGSKGRGDSVRGLSCTGNLGYQTETYSLHPPPPHPSKAGKNPREQGVERSPGGGIGEARSCICDFQQPSNSPHVALRMLVGASIIWFRGGRG